VKRLGGPFISGILGNGIVGSQVFNIRVLGGKRKILSFYFKWAFKGVKGRLGEQINTF